jgi:hypothetical protein
MHPVVLTTDTPEYLFSRNTHSNNVKWHLSYFDQYFRYYGSNKNQIGQTTDLAIITVDLLFHNYDNNRVKVMRDGNEIQIIQCHCKVDSVSN